jgi:protein involved in polysaccharide export with SLBB domain
MKPLSKHRITLRSAVLGVCCLLGLLALPTRSSAQVAPTMDRRPQATRAELQARLVEIDQILAGIYSEGIKQQVRAEAVMIQERLRDGDFQIGDQLQVQLSVAVTPTGPPINGTFSVGPDQILQLPELPPIPLRGVLRSEVKDYMTEFLSHLFKDQTVNVVPTIRLTIQGGVKQPGFYQLPADITLPDAITKAGGFGGGTDLSKTVIKRDDEELWGTEEMSQAITAAVTLDQLNLRSGDELIVGQTQTTDWFHTLRTYAIIPGLILSLAALGRLFGII